MTRLLTLTLTLLCASPAMGQTNRRIEQPCIGCTYSTMIVPPDKGHKVKSVTISNVGKLRIGSSYLNEFLDLYTAYDKECLIDTIKAEKFEGEYLIQFGYTNMRELVTERQLEDRGYRYKYRWIKNQKQPFEWEYIFLRQQTFPGFMAWLRKRTK